MNVKSTFSINGEQIGPIHTHDKIKHSPHLQIVARYNAQERFVHLFVAEVTARRGIADLRYVEEL